ncbi:hypothetical protein V2E39_08890 [Chryseobacterium arthrosphaerae]|uniref:Glycine zipper family protein n=1 Tax=Chryseobacterium arthrosphaerae TaxID=651561 RepID=A0A1B8ZEQ6_9FLAO|nr:hypothetical protein [Chryseobacterium arthrosphaerae]AYZ10751.1 hypothetical protein EGY05_01795 [Chryseobacterium arthrosphaerae]MDG4652898.1 hypothetical protein [Chryseobacterium arthrosphaerae]OCA70090.1 hypothetical protein BBI00_19785 [Chryseobacterium arthrosphaerae]QUY56107.1 hypothetical protein I2F65_01770 [Chryseobacterium arthrosphaerae]UEQ75984.1 hypothetical protein J8N07_20510 [Chryseobacterium arthrosphaerae]
MKKLFSLFIVFGLLISCVSKKNQAIRQNILTLKDSYCKAPFKYNYTNKLPSYNSDSILEANKDLKEIFSDQSILILNALDNLDEVHDIMELKKDSSLASQVRVLQLKTKINSKITIALTELDAVAAEFDCEGERVAQIGNYVDNLNASRNNKMILYSIVAGAAASIAGGIVKDEGWSNAIDISGGVLGAGFGLATLNPKGKKVEFIHQRNLLRDVWRGKLESPNFPPFIWYMYTEKKFSNREERSIIGNMKERWLHYQFDDNKSAADQSVIFSDGGFYRSDDLHNRAAMLNQMQSATRTINQNINYLLLDLDKLIL